MRVSESPIVHFVRGVTLLATLFAVPGIAIFWNHFPKDIVSQAAPKATAAQSDDTQPIRKDFDESVATVATFTPESVYPPSPEVSMEPAFSLPAPKTASEVSIQQVSWDPSRRESPHNFESLEHRLKTLGATYYRLEKWGNRGELFRFSCLVTPSEPSSYEKHFQSIGSDVVTVMRSVIAEIEAWKNVQ